MSTNQQARQRRNTIGLLCIDFAVTGLPCRLFAWLMVRGFNTGCME